MNISSSLFEGVIVMFAIISVAVLLKKIGFLKQDDSLLFSRIVLQVTLPAVVFSALAQRHFDNDYLIMAGIMAIIELGMIVLAWGIATVLNFKPGEKGALILVSAFGMTTLLGYPIIEQVFPGNPQAMEEAVVTSEFGVGLLLFIFGPIIASYYGESNVGGSAVLKSVQKFFFSPIFIALIAGIAFSFLPINHENQIFTKLIHFFKQIGNANLLMVAFTIGLIIEIKQVKHVFLFMLIAVLLKLGLKPLLAVWLTNNAHFSDMMREIVFIETALPSALLVAVFAKQYKCRPDLVSLAIMLTLLFCVFSVGLLFISFF